MVMGHIVCKETISGEDITEKLIEREWNIKVHRPVMCEEVIKYLNLRPGKVVVDCTIGCGGHAEAIVRNIEPGGKLIGIDRDEDALGLAEERLKNFRGTYHLINDNFRNLNSILDELKIEKIDGLLFDLGISSFQLDTPQRGFSINLEGPLDMRMNRNDKISAFDLVNHLPQHELAAILRSFGQEWWANRIARAIVTERKRGPIATTSHLAAIIVRAIPYKDKRKKIHPATRTFQAIRIAVNNELLDLEKILTIAPFRLKPEGRLCIISFHSLEDRIAKHQFRSLAKDSIVTIITPKPVVPTADEVKANPRSRSGKLRVAEKI